MSSDKATSFDQLFSSTLNVKASFDLAMIDWAPSHNAVSWSLTLVRSMSSRRPSSCAFSEDLHAVKDWLSVIAGNGSRIQDSLSSIYLKELGMADSRLSTRSLKNWQISSGLISSESTWEKSTSGSETCKRSLWMRVETAVECECWAA